MTIIVLYILLGIIALIVILLHFSVRATIKASKQGVDIKVKWLFFTFYPRKPKKPKKPKKKKGEPDAVPEQTAEQPDLSENGIEQFIKEAEEVQEQTAAEEKTEETQDTAAKEEAATAKSEKKDNKKSSLALIGSYSLSLLSGFSVRSIGLIWDCEFSEMYITSPPNI